MSSQSRAGAEDQRAVSRPPADELTAITGRKALGRSALTNGNTTILPLGPAAVNRRRRDLIAIFGQEAGGFENLPAAGQQVVQSLAQVSVDIEVMTAERAAGRPVDPEIFLAHVNSQGRLLKTLRTHYRAKPKTALADVLAKYATGAVAK